MVSADKSILSTYPKHRLVLNATSEDGSRTGMQRRRPMTTKHPSEGLWRRGGPCLLGGALSAAAILGRYGIAHGGPPDTKPTSSAGEASHGALAMDRQEAFLAGWLGASASAAVPPGVAPSFWRGL